MPLILSLAYVLVFLWVLNRSSFFKVAVLPNQWLTYAFILKLFAGAVIAYIYTYHYTQRNLSDIYKYFDDGKIMAQALKERPADFFHMFFGLDNDPRYQLYYYNQMQVWNGRYANASGFETHILIRFQALLHIFSKGYFPVHQVFFNAITLLGIWTFYKAFLPWMAGKEKLFFIALMLTPGTLFWGSSMFRESFLLFPMGLFFYASFKFLDLANQVRTIAPTSTSPSASNSHSSSSSPSTSPSASNSHSSSTSPSTSPSISPSQSNSPSPSSSTSPSQFTSNQNLPSTSPTKSWIIRQSAYLILAIAALALVVMAKVLLAFILLLVVGGIGLTQRYQLTFKRTLLLVTAIPVLVFSLLVGFNNSRRDIFYSLAQKQHNSISQSLGGCFYKNATIGFIRVDSTQVPKMVKVTEQNDSLYQLPADPTFYYFSVNHLYDTLRLAQIQIQIQTKTQTKTQTQTQNQTQTQTQTLSHSSPQYLHPNPNPNSSPNSPAIQSPPTTDLIFHFTESLAPANSYIQTPWLTPGPSSFIRATPSALFNSLFRPFPLEGHSLLMLMASLENLLLWIPLFALLIGALIRKKTLMPFSLWLLSGVLIYFVIIGWLTPNLGSLVRYKVPVLPILVTFMVLISAPFRHPFQPKN